jgi:hypothetical protein
MKRLRTPGLRRRIGKEPVYGIRNAGEFARRNL